MRVPLGTDHWAEIKPVEQLTRADRKAVNAAIVFEQVPGEPDKDGKPVMHPVLRGSMDDDIAEAILCRVCTDWSLSLPPPATDPAGLERLTLQQDDELRKAIEPHIRAVLGDGTPHPDNEVPTRASVSLGGIWQDFPATKT